jgi:hypothetical protein
MRNTAAIFLLIIYGFNLVGYKIFFHLIERKADSRLEASLDAEKYNDNDLVTIRVPLEMPYQVQSSSFERVYGEVRIDGNIYRYVKRKIDKGELVLLCIPNEKKKKLENSRDDFFKLANDYQNTKKSDSNKGNILNTLFVKHITSSYEWSSSVITTSSSKQYKSLNFKLHSAFVNVPGQPPEA